MGCVAGLGSVVGFRVCCVWFGILWLMFERFHLDFVVFSSFVAIVCLGGGEFMGNILGR